MIIRPDPPSLRRALLTALPAGMLAGLLGGCVGGINDAPRFEFFVLEDLESRSLAAAPPAGPASDRVLLVSLGQSQALYDSDRIVFSSDGANRAFFQYSNWSERPARRLAALLERRLAGSGRFKSVAMSTAGLRGDLVLSIRLDEFYLDQSASPPAMRVVVLAELLDWRSRAMVSRLDFAERQPVGSVDVRGTAQAASIAVTRLIGRITGWTAQATQAA